MKIKKLLSIFLALALVISMIPATFAAGEETATPNELEYVFNYGVFGLTYSSSQTEYPYTTSKGIALNGYADYFNEEKSDPWTYVDEVNLYTSSIRKDGSLYVTHD